MSRMFPPGAPLSPSGYVVMDTCGRRGRIDVVVPTGTCTWCGGAVAKPRRTWCSDECVRLYYGTQPARIREDVLERDDVEPHPRRAYRVGRRGCRCSTCGEPTHEPEVDHIVPIIEGGHPFDLANLRVLCGGCHSNETAALARRRAEARRRQQEIPGC